MQHERSATHEDRYPQLEAVQGIIITPGGVRFLGPLIKQLVAPPYPVSLVSPKASIYTEESGSGRDRGADKVVEAHMGVTTPDYVCPMALDEHSLARPMSHLPGVAARSHVAGA